MACVCELADAPISSKLHETFALPSKVFPVFPIVKVLLVANLFAVEALSTFPPSLLFTVATGVVDSFVVELNNVTPVVFDVIELSDITSNINLPYLPIV